MLNKIALGYAIGFILVFGTVGLVQADVQINQQEQYAHAPYDENNFDNELYIGSIGISANVQYEGTQSLTTKPEEVTIRPMFQPPELADLDVGEILNLDSTGIPEETCTITDVNGDARQANFWEIAIRKVDDITFKPTVNCSDRWN